MYIVLEGVDGVGKSTLSRLLHMHLQNFMPNNELLFVTEPYQGSPTYTYIRRCLTGELSASNLLLARAFYENRLALHSKVLAPFLLDSRHIVVSDRCYVSSMVYQTGDGLTYQDIDTMNTDAIRRPDLIVHVKASSRVMHNRLDLRSTRDITERELESKQTKYAQALDYVWRRGVSVIDFVNDWDDPDVAVRRLLSSLLLYFNYASEAYWFDLFQVGLNRLC